MAEVRREVDGSVLEMDVNRTSNTPIRRRIWIELRLWSLVGMGFVLGWWLHP